MIKRLIKKTVTAAAVAGILVSCGGNAKKQEVDMTDVDLIVKELSFDVQQPTTAQIEEAFNTKNVEYSSIACALISSVVLLISSCVGL